MYGQVYRLGNVQVILSPFCAKYVNTLYAIYVNIVRIMYAVHDVCINVEYTRSNFESLI